MNPYKELAIVTPLDIDKDVIELRKAGVVAFLHLNSHTVDKDEKYKVYDNVCKKCGISTLVSNSYYYEAGKPIKITVPSLEIIGNICKGKFGFWHWFHELFGSTRCKIKIDHFHVRCNQCDNRFIMAPKDKEI